MMAQGMGGLISMIGEPDRPPVKVPIAINDVMTGLYAAIGILAALRHRDVSGGGQHIDLGLLDVQVGWLFNQGLNYLTAGTIPQRVGTAHPNTVPYQGFATSDGWIILAANNDEQFKRFCIVAEHPELFEDSRFSSNSERVRNRHMLVPIIESILREKPSQHWLDGLERATVPCCPINNLEQVFQDPQVLYRKMKISMPHPLSANGQVSLIGNPIKLSQTAAVYRRPPPLLGEHTEELLNEVLGIQADERNRLKADGII
jgi:crotonobetainyl-CoA:carnitine CoA-transferase CaiB-like acyl-CoA transferase